MGRKAQAPPPLALTTRQNNCRTTGSRSGLSFPCMARPPWTSRQLRRDTLSGHHGSARMLQDLEHFMDAGLRLLPGNCETHCGGYPSTFLISFQQLDAELMHPLTPKHTAAESSDPRRVRDFAKFGTPILVTNTCHEQPEGSSNPQTSALINFSIRTESLGLLKPLTASTNRRSSLIWHCRIARDILPPTERFGLLARVIHVL
ncbi:hypothetical protein BD289DRAFT_429352, partial [Coniella lustricola]